MADSVINAEQRDNVGCLMNCWMSTKDFLRFNRRLSNTIFEETVTKYCC